MAGTTVERRVFGKTGLEVSVLGFGGSEIGYERATPEAVERLLNGALDAGLNVIDTAECYLTSEELIGQAVAHRRQDFYLFTKCGHASGLAEPDWSPALLEASIERSLRRLRTDYLDLVQLHSCAKEVLEQGEVIDVLRRARDEGKTRYIGYSGDQDAALYAVECGAFDTLQTSISIADQEAIHLTLPRARERGLGVIAKRPIANAAWKTGRRPADSYQQVYWDRLQKLRYDFLQNGSLEQSISKALRFTLSVPGVHTAIVGTTRPERWQENARFVEAGPLSDEEFKAIRDRWEEIAPRTWIGQT